MLRRIGIFILMFALAGLAVSGADAPNTNAAPAAPKPASTNSLFSSATGSDPVVAEAKDFKIRRNELDQQIAHAKRQIIEAGHPILAEQEDEIARQVLEQLINVRVLLARVTDADKVAGRQAAQKRLVDAKAQAGSEQAFDQKLNRMHVTTNELIAKWTDALTADTFLERQFKIKVTDQQVKDFYAAHPEQFEVPERFRIQMILVDTMDRKTRAPLSPDQQVLKLKRAEEVLAKIKAGGDFGALARQYSDDPVSKDKGGEYVFSRGDMVKEVQEAAFLLTTNEVSGVVTSSYGYHIVKLVERIPPRKIGFDEVSSDIKNTMVHEATREKFVDYIAALRNADDVKILDPKLQPLGTTDPNSFLRPRNDIKPQ